MRKKTLLAAGAVALTVCLAVGLTGCSETLTRAQQLKSSTVTEEEWKQAFLVEGEGNHFENCTVDMEMTTTTRSYSGGMYYNVTSYIEAHAVLDGTKEYSLTKVRQEGKVGSVDLADSIPDEEIYSETTAEGIGLLYQKNAAGEWSTTLGGSVGRTAIGGMLTLIGGVVGYDDVVFSEARGGYIAASDLAGEGPVFKFDEQGRLIAIYMQSDVPRSDRGRVATTISVVFAYGDAVVALPSLPASEGEIV